MSRLMQVIRNKNRVEKVKRRQREEELRKSREDNVYRSNLINRLSTLDVLLDDDNVEAIVIEVSDKDLTKFCASIYSSQLYDYDIQQVEGEPNKFYVRRKVVEF
ncbi:MAG: hypothetical protein QXD03_02495 [Candidatus Anstonellales archaeon]